MSILRVWHDQRAAQIFAPVNYLLTPAGWQQTLGAQFRPLFATASAALNLAFSFNFLVLGHESILSEFENQTRKKAGHNYRPKQRFTFLGLKPNGVEPPTL
jgi:hypothetical protein